MTSEIEERATARVKLLTGLDDAEARALVDAAVGGATDHVLQVLVGSGPVPTSMSAMRADQLRAICDRAGRLLSQREVEVLFRIPASTARTTVTTMLATYEEDLRERFLERMRADATTRPAGSDDEGLRWAIRFGETSTFQAALLELRRLGLEAELDQDAPRRTVTVPRTVQVGGEVVDVLGLLGLPAP